MHLRTRPSYLLRHCRTRCAVPGHPVVSRTLRSLKEHARHQTRTKLQARYPLVWLSKDLTPPLLGTEQDTQPANAPIRSTLVLGVEISRPTSNDCHPYVSMHDTVLLLLSLLRL